MRIFTLFTFTPKMQLKVTGFLNHGSMTANTNEEKAEMLNSFSTCFNPTFPPLSPSNVPTVSTRDDSIDLLCTEEDVYMVCYLLWTLQKHLGQMVFQQECLR